MNKVDKVILIFTLHVMSFSVGFMLGHTAWPSTMGFLHSIASL